MFWSLVMQIVSVVYEWIILTRRSAAEKELEILLLRRQLAMVERQQRKPLRPSRAEKLSLAVIATKFKQHSGRTIRELGQLIRIVKPATVFKWHQELVRRKWTYHHPGQVGRPRTRPDLEQLIVRLARENDWGKKRIAGEP